MILSVKKTDAFIEIKAKEHEITIYKSHPNEVQQAIDNLLLVLEDLASFTNKTVSEHVRDLDIK